MEKSYPVCTGSSSVLALCGNLAHSKSDFIPEIIEIRQQGSATQRTRTLQPTPFAVICYT
jgi:hypothetical protein